MDLPALADNIRTTEARITPQDLLIDLRGNACGLGIEAVVLSALRCGITQFLCTTANDGTHVRTLSLRSRIYVDVFSPRDVESYRHYALTPRVVDVDDAGLLAAGSDAAVTQDVFLTPSFVLSSDPSVNLSRLKQLVTFVRSSCALRIAAVASTLHPDADNTPLLVSLILELHHEVPEVPCLTLLEESAEGFATMGTIAVVGPSLYGFRSEETGLKLPFRLGTHVSAISSGRAIIPIGRRQGVRCRPDRQTEVLVGGRRHRLASVSDDLSSIALNDADSIREGSEVILIGQQGDERLTTLDFSSPLGIGETEAVVRVLNNDSTEKQYIA